jgi:acetyl esterase
MKVTHARFSADELEESRGLNAVIEQAMAQAPPVHTVDPAFTRKQQAEGAGLFLAPERLPHARTRTIAGPAGPMTLRVLEPEQVDGVYLHFHGGGWTIGAPDHQDPGLWRLATAANVAVVSAGYRLAPEHPFPAGPDDCEAAARWLVDHAAAEWGTDKLVIGGESAGAHLSALTLLRLRDRHGAAGAFRGANLVFGVFDVSGTPSARRWGSRQLVLSTPIMEWFGANFAPDRSPEEQRHPDISPLYADLRELCPALFTVGDLDPLLDDSWFMASRWHCAGNDTELIVYPESVHGFVAFPVAIAVRAHQDHAEFVRRVLAD